MGVLSLMPLEKGIVSYFLCLYFMFQDKVYFGAGYYAEQRWWCVKCPFVDALQGCTHASLVPTQLWRFFTK